VNLRRVIRFSVSAVVFLLAATAIGAVFVVADEGFGWDLFPDWLEKCLGVLLASVGVLTGLSLAACLTASAALIALSFANRQGVEEERRLSRSERRALGMAALAIVALLAGGIAFQKADDWRGRRLEEARRERHRLDYGATRELLERQAAFLAGKIPPELARAAADGRKDRDGEIAALLWSFMVSSRFAPSVDLVVRGNPPYLWKRMWPA